jgi:adenylate cyclase
MSTPFRQHPLRTLLVLAVFVIFLLNVAGFMQLRFALATGIAFRGGPFFRMLSEGNLPLVLQSSHFLVYVCIGLVLSVLLPALSPIRASLLTFICMLVPFWLGYYHPERPDVVPLEYMLLTILMLFVVNVLASYFTETHTRQRLMDVFGHYVPPEVVNAIARDPEAFSLEGEARELTVVFSDIKDFSTLSEHLDPRQLARMLNTYFTEMTDILHRHGATIDKYIGDAIMAFWGAPLAQPDHAPRGVAAALDMQRAMNDLRPRFQERGWPALEVGVGINTGIVNVGNMGSKYRVAYTVVGDAVNLSSRVEHLSRTYHAKVLVTESTMRQVPDIVFKEVDHVRVKGKGRATRIYEPICTRAELTPEMGARLERHALALAAYYARNWPEAEAHFTGLRDAGFNAPYCSLMLDRIAQYRASQPPPDWSGVTAFSTEL